MEIRAIETRVTKPILIGLLLVTALLITACVPTGGSDDEPPPPKPGCTEQIAMFWACFSTGGGGDDKATSDTPNPGPWPQAPTELTVSEPTNFTLTLDWIPPTAYTDGTTLTDIDGYVIRWTLFPDEDWFTAEHIFLQNPGLSAYVLDLPAPGVWYIIISTVANGGKGGPPSDLVNVEIL